MSYTNAFRSLLSFAALAAMISPAFAQLPTITGTVFVDNDGSGTITVGEGVGGVSVSLYEDNGDNVFNAASDTVILSTMTNSNGVYNFTGLGVTNSYFIHQAMQTTVGGVELPERLSTLTDPNSFAMTIDEFVSQQNLEANPIVPTVMTALTDPTVIGGQRDFHLQHVSGPADTILRSNPHGMAEVLQLDQAAGVVSIATITWDGVDGDLSTTPSVGLGGLDLSNGGRNEAFAFSLGVDAAGEGDVVTMKIFTGTAMSMATAPVTVTDGRATVVQSIAFADFTGDASFEEVDAIQLILGGQSPSVDMQLDSIGIVGAAVMDIAHVPEPAAFTLIGLAGLCLLGIRKRRA